MFQMMLKRILLARRQKPQLSCLCFTWAADLSVGNAALNIYWATASYSNATLHWWETALSLPDGNGVFWLCCASSWVMSSYYVIKALSPDLRGVSRSGFCWESLC